MEILFIKIILTLLLTAIGLSFIFYYDILWRN